MPVPVLTAVSGPWEAPLVAGLEPSATGVQVVRRCADLAELLAAAAAGLAGAAVVSADVPRLDGEAVARLRALDVAVVVLVDPTDPTAARRLRQVGVTDALPLHTPPSAVAEAVLAAVSALGRSRSGPETGQPSGGPGSGGPGSGVAGEDPVGSPGRAGGADLVPGEDLDLVLDGVPDGDQGAGEGAGERSAGDPFPGGGPPIPGSPVLGPVGGGVLGPDLGGGGLGLGRNSARRAALHRAGPPGRLIAVWGPTGAPGRTTVAVEIAAELAGLGLSTVVADADTYGPSLAQALALLDESAGLAAAVRAANQGALDVERLARLAPVVQPPGLRVLTGIPRPGRWPELRPTGLQLVWQVVRELAERTVVDCGFGLESDEEVSFDAPVHRRNGATLCTLEAADLVLVVGSADPVGLHRLVRGLQDLAEVLPAGRPRRVVVTRVRESAVGPSPRRTVADALARYAGVRDVVLVPDDRPAHDAAMLAGRTLAEVAPRSPARLALAALAAELAGVGPSPSAAASPSVLARRVTGLRDRWRKASGPAMAPGGGR